MRRHEREEDEPRTHPSSGRRFRQVAFGVVAALDVDVGSHDAQQTVSRVLVEDRDVVDGREGRDELGTFVVRNEGTAGFAHGAVAVDADDQEVTLRPGGPQVPHMADVQDVEDAVGENDPVAARTGRVQNVTQRVEIDDRVVQRGILAQPTRTL